MKFIKYTLTAQGTIPEYVTDGGYLAVANGGASPQDLDLVGVATDDAPQTGFANKAALIAYIESKGFEFKNPITEDIITVSTFVDTFWEKLG